MWNEPSAEELAKLPKLYETESVLLQGKIVRMHFFLGGSDWWAVEFEPERRIFFGFAILNDDRQNAEWGYFSLDELKAVKVRGFEIDRDLYWEPCRACEVQKIADTCGWKLDTRGGD